MSAAPPPQPYGSAPLPGSADATQPYGSMHDAVVQDAPTPSSSPYLAAATPGGYGYGGYPPGPPIRPTTPTLGWVALVAGGIALLGSIINGAIVAGLVRPGMFDGSTNSGDIAMLTSFGLANLLFLWFLVALWAIVQGIVAMAQKRGLWQGLVGMLLGLIGPWIGVVVAVSAFMTAFAEV